MRERYASSIAMKWKEDMIQLHGGGRMEGKRSINMHKGCASSTAIKKALP